MSRAARTEEAAARWLLRREEPDWSVDDQAELEAWMEAAPENRVTFWRLEYGWSKVDRLAALRSPSHDHARRGLWGRLKERRVALAGMAIAAGLVLVVLLSPPSSDVGQDGFHMTNVGEQRAIPLADGSHVELNTATRLRAEVDDDRREVWLDEGEAYFEVARDEHRPFVVHAGPQTITVLGTKFSVWRDGDRVRVAVLEGRVRVDDVASARPVPGARQPESAHLVQPGDIVIAEGPSTMIAARSTERVADIMSWREGQLTFDQATLAEAVEEFNRYNAKQLVVIDPAVADIRIGGRFEAGNVDAFTRLLRRGFGLRIEDDGRQVRISG